jgi:transcriptional regulator with XRE-family HTH domain
MNLLAERLKQICKDRSLNQRELAKVLGISESYMSEIFKGSKAGRRKMLDFAVRLGVSSEYLLGEGAILIPIMCEISAHGPEPMLGEPVETIDVSMLPGLDKNRAKGFYAVRVKDDSMMPIYKTGDVLLAEKVSVDQITSGDKAVFKTDEVCWVRFIEFVGDMAIIRSLPSGEKEIFKRSDLAKMNMDKVVYVISS